MADDTITNAIAENAAAPKRAKGDQGEVEQHSLADQIEADRYLRDKALAAKPHKGLKFARMRSPGAAE